MAQENFAGPEYFTEFDPEKFFQQLTQKAEQDKEEKGREDDSREDPGEAPAGS